MKSYVNILQYYLSTLHAVINLFGFMIKGTSGEEETIKSIKLVWLTAVMSWLNLKKTRSGHFHPKIKIKELVQ